MIVYAFLAGIVVGAALYKAWDFWHMTKDYPADWEEK